MRSTEPDSSPVAAVTISLQSLLNERFSLQANTRHQPAGSGLWTGNFRGSRRGHGSDFDDLRHYSPGDEMRYIDWNASARTNTLHTRLYREEREHRVTLIVDLRNTMFTGTRELRSVKASLLAARLLWQAIDRGSRTSVIVICDSGLCASEYGNGHRAAINACGLLARRFHDIQQKIDSPGRRSMQLESRLEPSMTVSSDADNRAVRNPAGSTTAEDVLITLPALPGNNGFTQTSCEQVAHWLITQRQLHGTMLWISAFDQLGNGFNAAMSSLSQAARQAAIHVHDEMLEHGLPRGHYGYRTGHRPNRTSQAVTLSRQHSIQLQEKLLQQKRERVALFSGLKVPLLSTDSGNTGIVLALRQSGHLP